MQLGGSEEVRRGALGVGAESCEVVVGGSFETRETGKARRQGWAKQPGHSCYKTRGVDSQRFAGRPFAIARVPMIYSTVVLLLYSNRGILRSSP
jgi:hypothetical protein